MAYLCRFNVPAAISVVWITNPITWPFILYWQYRLGLWLLGQPGPGEFRTDKLLDLAADVPGPLLLGCAVTGLVAAAAAYSLVNTLWGALAERWWRGHALPLSSEARRP
jgi:uncharacterized protein (DUF2062 family)